MVTFEREKGWKEGAEGRGGRKGAPTRCLEGVNGRREQAGQKYVVIGWSGGIGFKARRIDWEGSNGQQVRQLEAFALGAYGLGFRALGLGFGV